MTADHDRSAAAAAAGPPVAEVLRVLAHTLAEAYREQATLRRRIADLEQQREAAQSRGDRAQAGNLGTVCMEPLTRRIAEWQLVIEEIEGKLAEFGHGG
jgi:chromosome segregation ATPase